MKQNIKANLFSITLSAVFAALIAVMSQIAIPIPGGVPITMQTFAVALTGYTLGIKRSTLSTVVYIILGVIGVPVFSGFKGGLQVLFGTTGGFISGFVFMAFLCGISFKLKPLLLKIAIGIAGLVICHILGIIQFAIVYKTGLATSALTVSIPYLIKDLISVIAAYFIASKVRSGLKYIGI